jgi:uncharacterized membrane protein
MTDRIPSLMPSGFPLPVLPAAATEDVSPGAVAAAREGAQPAVRPPRYGFVDLLRGFALIVMIETHVVNSYLYAESRHSPFFFWLTFFNGLVAPSFLFASGFSLILQANRFWDDWLHLRLPFWKQMRRLGFITLVAYYSHLQHFRLSKYLNPDRPGLWAESLQVDILQCIVVSLLLVNLVILVTRNKTAFVWGAASVAAAVSIATPWMWARDFRSSMPLSVALFLNPHGVSLFPLFPWLGFLLAGSCASSLFLRAVKGKTDPRFMRNMVVVGVAMIVGGLLLRRIPFTLPGRVSFYTTSPLYAILRIGCVLLVCALFYWMERHARWTAKPVRLAGQESLLVYGVHLWVIFALLRGKEVGPVLGLEAGYLRCFLISAVVVVFMLWLARNWHALKANYPRFTRRAQAATVVALILVFLAR